MSCARVFLIMLVFSDVSFAQDKIEENKVIGDWEAIQRGYPQTEKFEKLEDRIFQIKNSGFDYDGKIVITNVVIEYSETMSAKTAEIMTELDKPRDEFYSNNMQSFSRWDQTNYLVFDKSKDKWVRYRDLASKPCCQKNNEKNQSLWNQLIVACFPILLIVVIFMAFYRSMSKGGKNINERLLDSNLEIAKELKRIADHLDKKG